MTKLEKLKAALDTARDAYNTAEDSYVAHITDKDYADYAARAAYYFACDVYAAADKAYRAELKKTQE